MEILPRRITIKWLVYLIDRIGLPPLLKIRSRVRFPGFSLLMESSRILQIK